MHSIVLIRICFSKIALSGVKSKARFEEVCKAVVEHRGKSISYVFTKENKF